MPDAYTDSHYQILPNKEAIAAFNRKMVGISYSYLDVVAHEHTVAFTVAKMMDADMLADTKDAIRDALENGTDFNTFKKRLKPYLMSKGWWGEQMMTDPLDGVKKRVQLGSTRRLRTIFHTNLHTAYAAGQWERIQETKNILPYLQYMPSHAGEPREAHKRWYGLVRPVDDPIWQTIMPPNGYGCLCWVKQLTRREAAKIGISEPSKIELTEYVNKRTGELLKVPKDITPSFAHNHGDRLSALMKLAQDKHGTEFARQLESQLDAFVLKSIKPDTVELLSFAGVVARQSEIDRLISEGVRDYEAEIADQWQQHFGVKVMGFEKSVHKQKNLELPDLVIYDSHTPASEWQTVDIMFKISKQADVKAFNQSFYGSKKLWERTVANIIKHLNKADIVPMYLDNFDPRTRTKILSFVLSLSKEQQQQIVLITDKPL